MGHSTVTGLATAPPHRDQLVGHRAALYGLGDVQHRADVAHHAPHVQRNASGGNGFAGDAPDQVLFVPGGVKASER